MAARAGDELTCTQFTCFTGTKVQILTPEELRRGATQVAARAGDAFTCTQFTCFTGTKLVLLMQVAGDIAVPPALLAAASVYLLNWYKSTRTDAAGA